MSYDLQEDWQQFPPAWRDLQIHKCLCTMKGLIEQLPTAGSTPLVYRALLTQAGTDAPTAIELENTTGATISFSYNGTGSYSLLASSPVFTNDKTFVQHNGVINANTSIPSIMSTVYGSDTTISIFTSAPTEAGGGALGVFAVTDSILNDSEITILIYP